jgi:hypothetical protein
MLLAAGWTARPAKWNHSTVKVVWIVNQLPTIGAFGRGTTEAHALIHTYYFLHASYGCSWVTLVAEYSAVFRGFQRPGIGGCLLHSGLRYNLRSSIYSTARICRLEMETRILVHRCLPSAVFLLFPKHDVRSLPRHYFVIGFSQRCLKVRYKIPHVLGNTDFCGFFPENKSKPGI